MSVITTIFFISIATMLLVLVSRYFRLGFLRKYDPATQAFVTKLSSRTLLFSNKIKRFVLVHFYKMSTNLVKDVLKNTGQKSEGLMEKLKGSTPKLSRQRVDEGVSPYLREISKIDRRGE